MQAAEPHLSISPVAGQHATLAFEMKSLDAFCEDLRAKGITLASDPTDHPEWGLRTAFLHDPDGNLLCLYKTLSE